MFFFEDEIRCKRVSSQNKEKFEDYEGFVEKFKPKLTTDDCYTPPLVYEAVADWAAKEYHVDKSCFVRPFYPGGDYVNYDYSGGKVVVDNPPFSILSQLVRFYCERGVPFLLFAPTLCSIQRCADFCTALPVGVDVTYENGAEIKTSFVTNLEPYETRVRVVPSLYEAVKKANDENRREQVRTLPKYVYPAEVVTVAAIYPFAGLGIEFVVPRSESVRVSALDSQWESKKSIFGCGWLVSAEVKAEREKAEREKAERWQLSDRERAIIAGLAKVHN